MTVLTDQMLLRLLDAAPEAMLAIDTNGTIVMANRQAGFLFGFSDDEMLGKSIDRLIPIDYLNNQRTVVVGPLSGQRQNGEVFLAEISLSVLPTDSDPLTIVCVRDVSARAATEAERSRLESAAEGALLEAEAARVKAEGDKTVAERVRLEAEAARVKAEGDKTVAERVRLEAEAARVMAEDEKTVAERVRLEAEAARVKAEDEKTVAERVRLEAEAARVKAEDEKTVAERVRLEAEAARVKAEGEKSLAEGVRLEAEVQRLKAEREKSEAERARLESEIELERLQGLVHQSQRMESLGQLAGGVAHDFNNLLAVILNYASFVSEELTKAVSLPQGTQWRGPLDDVNQIQIAAERASVLTHQLLAFARREVIQARSLNFNEALTNIEEMLRRTIGEQIELTIELADGLSNVLADPGHIEQIILNLAINARDAMPTGGTLVIETSSRSITETEWSLFGAPAGPYICVRFSDNGSGMSEEIVSRAFEPFFTTKPRGEGSGLGLATVYGIVLQSGGYTKIYSDEGVGTTITILLPVDGGAEESDAQKARFNAAKSPAGTETVLVVDDEEGLREVSRRILARFGYTVLTASSGAEALEIAGSHVGRIELLLTDVIMPKMQGPTVANEVRKLLPNIKVLFMSGHAQPVLEAEADLGTDFQLVEKPFDQRMLLTSVRAVLDAGHRSAA